MQHQIIPRRLGVSYAARFHFRGRSDLELPSRRQLDPHTQPSSSEVVDTSTRLQIIDDNEFPGIERATQSSWGRSQSQQTPGQQEEVNNLTAQHCRQFVESKLEYIASGASIYVERADLISSSCYFCPELAHFGDKKWHL